MPQTYFADSSALVKRHVAEIGSRWFSQLADAQTGNTIIISRLSISEIFSAFNRRFRELISKYLPVYFFTFAIYSGNRFGNQLNLSENL